ncbi:hypothetical protein FANTH_10003 [Fusarium anthophilum]|uniref:aldehyde dehydrogenase (NAD(+)) n=1 Tax=Fusarium anthophilum TaxID=48485 RepID=A0A8H5DXD7_9HYPO|nr:hypothetical protein FANTH_10003 [Fusarium anthophilum]
MASVQPPNPLPPDQNVGPILLGISGTCLALVVITTSVRIWVRTALRSSGWDDYTIVIVTLLGVARFGVQVGQVSIGNGRHRWFIEPEDYVQNNKLGWVAQILLFAILVIWNTSLPLKTKISVWALMSLGLVATGFGIARAASLGVVTSDLSWVYAITAIWSNLELYLGIVGANLALSRSIFAYFFREGGTTKGSSYADRGPEDVDAAVDAAKKAFPAWKKTHPEVRKALVPKLADFIDENAEAILALTTLTVEAPKSIPWAMQMSSALFRYFAGWIDKIHGESRPADNCYMQVARHEPLGVTFGMPLSQQAITTSTGPPRKRASLPSPSCSTGSLLSHRIHVKKVSFTSSVPVWKKILSAATAANLKQVSLELVRSGEWKSRSSFEARRLKAFDEEQPVGYKSFWFPPTAFIEVAEESEITTKEIFGPVFIIREFKEGDRVISRANNSEYGLAAGVFTRGINRALRVAGEFEAGMVGIICISTSFSTNILAGIKNLN